MDRNTKTDPNATGKFGKFLAVGMAVALIWGVLLLIVGIYMRFKFGTVLSGLIGDLEGVVKVKSAQNSQGQNMVPISSTISDDVTVGKWTNVLASIVIVVALLTILFACQGIYGGIKHSKFVLYITIVFLLISALFLVGLTSVATDSSNAFHEDAKNELVELLRKYKIETTDDVFILAMNRIMLWFECCGIRNYGEFTNLTFTEICADRTIKILFMGCYDAVFDSVSTPAMVVLILILIWDILVLLLAILTIMEIKPEEEGRESIPEVRKEELEEAPPVKKFVPYAKISSFVHPDLSRIKSTEIW